MKVKNYPNWQKILFSDRAILKTDMKYFSYEQIESLNNLEVLYDCDNGKTLVIEER